LKPSNVGDIYLEGSALQSTWSLITRIYNTFNDQNPHTLAKHDGPNTFPLSTSSFVSILVPTLHVPDLQQVHIVKLESDA